MPFWKRADSTDRSKEIGSFWTWWAEARHRIAGGIADGTVASLSDEISRQVHAIDAKLAWEMSAGVTAQHAFAVSPEGNLATRPRALAWLDAAPAPDSEWEYHASRQPGPLGRLAIGNVDVDLAGFRAIAGWDTSRERLDVRLWHERLVGLPRNAQLQVAYLFLDSLFGEDNVERWIGSIDLLDDPIGGRTPEELQAELDRQTATATGQSWVLATRDDGRTRALVLANLALKPIDYAQYSHHLTVVVDRGIEQLAKSGETPSLDDAEDQLVEAMPKEAAVNIGHVTEARRRVIHFMCADPEIATGVAETWAKKHREFGSRVDARPDPNWEFRRQLGL